MPLQLTISDQATQYLNEQARLVARERVERYADDVLKEAGRLEAAASGAGGDPEITSSMVRDADLLLRRGYRKPPRNRWLIAAQLVAPLGGILTGFLGQTDFLQKPGLLVLFIAVLTITIITTVVSVFKD
jgi:hypothetical protein